MTADYLERIKDIWVSEKEYYYECGEKLKDAVHAALRDAGIPATYSFRVKTDASLYKKILGRNKQYEELTDKVGARTVVHFQSDLRKADLIITNLFGSRIKRRDDKLEAIDEYTFGYLSIHYDIEVQHSNSNYYLCEMQLRTVCQNTWSELSHILTYKPEAPLPREIKREVNALSALMEIADNQFQKVYDMIIHMPMRTATRILRTINDFFYSEISSWFDTEMSYRFLDGVSDLYTEDENIENLLRTYISDNGDDIAKIATARSELLFYSQPEIVPILERLATCPNKLACYWEKIYPVDLLEQIAIAWGTPLAID